MGATATIQFILGGVPFILPASFVIREESNASLDVLQLPPDSLRVSLPIGSFRSNLSVTVGLTTGSDFFLNSYSLFKGAIESLAILQTMKSYPEELKFASYIGINELMPKGQLQAFSFFSEPNSTNVIRVALAFERREIRASSGALPGGTFPGGTLVSPMSLTS